MNIRIAEHNDLEKCVNLARKLSDWFDEQDIKKYEKSIYKYPVYLYEEEDDNNNILGFICIINKSNRVVEIEFFAVDINSHHQGIGTKLLKFIETEVAPGKIIEVKTLDESCEYEPYAKTRLFYENNGFTKIDVICPFPGWHEDCPCAIYVKK